jgi:tRNA threonylcarbamoyladenosine biosynthesis protein TsaE
MPESSEFLAEFEYSIDSIETAAAWLIKNGQSNKIWVFDAELGGGKTTLIAAVCRLLGVDTQVSSPTFALIHEYQTEKGQLIYHLDLYRLKTQEEAIDAGVEAILHSGLPCMVEWGLLFPELLPMPYLLVNVNFVDEQRRQLRLSIYE